MQQDYIHQLRTTIDSLNYSVLVLNSQLKDSNAQLQEANHSHVQLEAHYSNVINNLNQELVNIRSEVTRRSIRDNIQSNTSYIPDDSTTTLFCSAEKQSDNNDEGVKSVAEKFVEQVFSNSLNR